MKHNCHIGTSGWSYDHWDGVFYPQDMRKGERLEGFLSLLPSDLLYAFEFRDESWFEDSVFTLLKEKKSSLCIYHMPDFLSPIKITADFVYIRFHGTESL